MFTISIHTSLAIDTMRVIYAGYTDELVVAVLGTFILADRVNLAFIGARCSRFTARACVSTWLAHPRPATYFALVLQAVEVFLALDADIVGAVAVWLGAIEFE